MKKTTIAIIGCGRIAQNAHFPALTTLENVRIKYACDLIPEKAEAMKEKYPNAEIYCLTYQESNHSNTSRSKLAKFTQSVSAIAEYFGATVVDQSKDEITTENCHAYGADYRALHPNAKGHAVMAKSIVTEMYKNNK